MASSSNYVFPQEGLNYLLGVAPRGNAFPATTYLGLFTTSWGTIQGYGTANTNITVNSGTYPVTELAAVSGIGYARAALVSGTWGAPTAGTTVIGANTINVQQSTYGSAQTFTCQSGTWANINGIFIATMSGVGSASNPAASPQAIVLWYAPFADLGTVTLASGDSLSITPTWQSAPYPA
jgi:hypothetical protein